MKKTHRILLAVALCLMICFLSIGYAAVTDTLWITGQAYVEGKPYEGVYITNVEVVGTSNAGYSECEYVLPTSHVTTVDAVRSGGSITYRITVYNNTDVTYWYAGTRYVTDYEQNGLIGANNGISLSTKDHMSDSNHTFNVDDWIPPQTEREFYVVYTYGSNAQNACRTMVNFHFDLRMDAVHDEFLAVLNNTKSPGSYEQLVNAFEQQYNETGGVTISTESHPELFASLFGDLMVDIDGAEKQASVVIRREDMDNDGTTGDAYAPGPSGCEYSLYITVEPLTPGTNPTVYAIVYSEGSRGMGDAWYQVGELYEGTAPVKADGTIDYENWVAKHKTYTVANGIEYIVGAPNGDQYDIMKTLEQLASAEDQDIFNFIDNTNIFKKVYDIIQKHKTSDDPAVVGLRKAFTDASHFYNNFNNGQEFKVVRGVYTRAEIIPALEKIQSALDYYYQAYPN